MNIRSIGRRIALMSAILVLLAVTWMVISGGRSQMPRCQTIGQGVETIIQLASGVLGIMVVVTCFYWRRLRRTIRLSWAISLSLSAGVSSLVWGPPMVAVGIVFAAGALLVALAILWLLNVGGA